MTEDTELPFPEVLDLLLVEDPLPIHLIYRLSDLSGEALAQFNDRWNDAPEERRRVITQHLADISETNYLVDFQSVFISCMGDPAASVRAAALDGVWDSTNTSLIEPIMDLMQTDDSVEVRSAAASALAHYVLLVEWGQLPAMISPPIVETLLVEYEKAETPFSVKRAALEALSAANHPRVVALIEEAYESDEPDLQLTAVFAMGGSADSRWLPIILDEMSNPSAEMRAEAAGAAGGIGDSAAVSELANLTVDENLDVALAAVDALGQIGGELAVSILVQLAEDPEFEALHEAVDEALEEVEWLDGTFDVLSLADDNEFEEN